MRMAHRSEGSGHEVKAKEIEIRELGQLQTILVCPSLELVLRPVCVCVCVRASVRHGACVRVIRVSKEGMQQAINTTT